MRFFMAAGAKGNIFVCHKHAPMSGGDPNSRPNYCGTECWVFCGRGMGDVFPDRREWRTNLPLA